MDMAVLLSEPEAGRPSVVGTCDVPFRYGSEPIPRYRGTVPSGTVIFTVSRQQFMKYPG